MRLPKDARGTIEDLAQSFRFLLATSWPAPDQSCSRKLKNKILHSASKKNTTVAWRAQKRPGRKICEAETRLKFRVKTAKRNPPKNCLFFAVALSPWNNGHGGFVSLPLASIVCMYGCSRSCCEDAGNAMEMSTADFSRFHSGCVATVLVYLWHSCCCTQRM